jgi:hypothetical protein
VGMVVTAGIGGGDGEGKWEEGRKEDVVMEPSRMFWKAGTVFSIWKKTCSDPLYVTTYIHTTIRK